MAPKKRIKDEIDDDAVDSAGGEDEQTSAPAAGKKICPICGASFSRIYELNRHAASHLGPQDHVCETCGAGFARKDALTRHQRTAQGTCVGKTRARRGRNSAAAFATNLANLVLNPWEPSFLLLPLPANYRSLLDDFAAYGWLHTPFHHLPTLFAKLERVAGTQQTRADYTAAGLCPVLAQAVIFTAARLGENDAMVDLWGTACWANLLAWASRLGLEPNDVSGSSNGTEHGQSAGSLDDSQSSNAGDVTQTVTAPPEELYRFRSAGGTAAAALIALGRATAASRLREWSIRAHRLAAVGSDLREGCVRAVDGSWTTTRNPDDLAGWIDAEEKVRVALWLATWDGGASESQGTKITMLRCGYILRGGEIRCSERGGNIEDEAEEAFEQGYYGNLPLPCPDVLFDSLPAAYDAATWRLHPAYEQVTRWTPIPFQTAQEFMHLPYGSPERLAITATLFGTFFETGVAFQGVLLSGLQGRLAKYREFCLARGFAISEPPEGWAEEEQEARRMREELILEFDDMRLAVPAELVDVDERGDGAAVLNLSRNHWGPKLEMSMMYILSSLHAMFITLNSPRDFTTDLLLLTRRLESKDIHPGSPADPLVDILECTSNPNFLVASSHAIRLSQFVRSILAIEPGPQDGGRPRLSLAKTMSPLWPMRILRAAWIHVLCILGCQKIVESGVDAEAAGVSPEMLGSLLEDVSACLRSIDETADAAPLESRKKKARFARNPWRYTSVVHGVMRKVLGVDFGLAPKDRTLDLTEEEVATLSQLRDLGS